MELPELPQGEGIGFIEGALLDTFSDSGWVKLPNGKLFRLDQVTELELAWGGAVGIPARQLAALGLTVQGG